MDNPYTGPVRCPTLSPVDLDRLFEDLDGQLAAELEATRAAWDAESERLRISGLSLLRRLQTMHRTGAAVTVVVGERERSTGRIDAVGADWIAMRTTDAPGAVIVPLAAVRELRTDHATLLESLADTPHEPSLRDRMTLGFVLRDLARRRIPLRIGLEHGEVVHGTVDRAGADHLDLAEHDAGVPRRAAEVRGFRVLPFPSVSWISADAGVG